jgi:hypothetical protein
MRCTAQFTVAKRSSFFFAGGKAITVHEPKFGSCHNLKNMHSEFYLLKHTLMNIKN